MGWGWQRRGRYGTEGSAQGPGTVREGMKRIPPTIPRHGLIAGEKKTKQTKKKINLHHTFVQVPPAPCEPCCGAGREFAGSVRSGFPFENKRSSISRGKQTVTDHPVFFFFSSVSAWQRMDSAGREDNCITSSQPVVRQPVLIQALACTLIM